MHTMKKNLIRLVAVVMMVTLLLGTACSGSAAAEEKKLNIVTTIFPVYDWVREVLGDRADQAQMTMLLDSGTDLHSYQPSAPDILKIQQADVFIFIGGESDEWVDDVLAVVENQGRIEINLMEALGEDAKEEETVEGMEVHHHHDGDEDEDHDHEEDEDHDHDGDHDHDEEEETEYDEHIWLSVRNAAKLVRVIADALAEKDPDGADEYRANAEAYAAKLNELDQAYAEAVAAGARTTILFGDRFPFRYLAADYGLTYYAAFSGCSAESEASFETVLFLAQKVDELELPVVLTIENAKTGLAETIVRSTAKGNQQILSMDSLQSVTAQKLETGITYLAVMTDNLEVLKQALQ